MLYDPKWTTTKHPHPFPFVATLDDLIAWLQTKDPAETYDYGNGTKCLLCQFLNDRGVTHAWANPFHWGDCEAGRWHDGGCRPLPGHFNKISFGSARDGFSWSFGAALKRALACREQQQ